MPASIFNGDAVKILKNILRFRSNVEVITGDSDDPTSVAKDAPRGSLYIRSGADEVYLKTDAGSSTNWVNIITGAGASLTASRATESDGSGNLISSTVTATELGYLSGVTSALQTQLDAKLALAGGTMTGNLVLNADATAALGAATKQQVDAAVDGIQRKASVVVATTANITLSGEQTIDGVLTSASRVLVKDQTDQTQNGIYLSAAGAWARTSDANSSSELNHAITSVQSGTVNSNTAWEQTTDNPNVGTDNIVWIQAYGAGTYTADESTLTLTGSVFSVANGGISNTQINASAGIDASKLADGSVSNTELQFINSLSSNAQTQIDGKEATITGAATTITSTNLTASRALSSNASGKVAVATTTLAELNFVSGVTSAIQTQIDAKENTITGAATTITSTNLTASRALSSNASGKVAVATTTLAELNFVSGVTSAIQTQINGKENTITGAATTITGTDLTASRALESNGSGKVAVSSVTSTELGHVSGVTSAIQTQLDSKIGFSVSTISAGLTAVVGTTYLTDTSGGAFTISLPSSPSSGDFVIVKDSTGDANGNNVTVDTADAATIDGSASIIINSNFQSSIFVSNGTNWFIL